MKICTKCGGELPLDDFYPDKRSRDGKRSWCKKCAETDRRNYRRTHPQKRVAESLKYRQTYPEKVAASQRKWRQSHREEVATRQREYNRIRLKTDPAYKLAFYLRIRLRQALNGKYKTGSAVRDMGCSVDYLKAHLEGQFQPGMTWENWGLKGWHVDHIRPLTSFDLTDLAQLREACHYTNLQPLWAAENLSKRCTPGKTVKQLILLENAGA